MDGIPDWHIAGDWFDNCSCAVPCPCTFAQAPDNGFCESVLFWHVREGHYGDVKLDNLSFVRVGRWEGDLWARQATGVGGGAVYGWGAGCGWAWGCAIWDTEAGRGGFEEQTRVGSGCFTDDRDGGE